MKSGASPGGAIARLPALGRRVRRARRRVALARARLTSAVTRRNPDSDSTASASAREPKSLCRTCGTTFETLAYTCTECDGATIEPLPARADGGTDDVVENPP